MDNHISIMNTLKSSQTNMNEAETKAEYEFFNHQTDLLPNLKEINQRCEMFNDKYNNRRFHQAIHYKTPSEYVYNYQ